MYIFTFERHSRCQDTDAEISKWSHLIKLLPFSVGMLIKKSVSYIVHNNVKKIKIERQLALFFHSAFILCLSQVFNTVNDN